MEERKEIAAYFEQNRIFKESEELYNEILPKLTDYQSNLIDSNDIESFIILMYALDDKTEMFEITQIFIESISLCYYKFKQSFFSIFLENIEIIYPHAINMTSNILSPILYDDNEARQYLCNSLDSVDNEKLLIFKAIYSFMIEEDNSFQDDCIMKKLELI